MAERVLLKKEGNIGEWQVKFFQTDSKGVKTEKVTTFKACAGPEVFKAYVAGLSDVKPDKDTPSQTEVVFSHYLRSVETAAKAAEREQIAAERTDIVRDGKKIELMDLPVAKACAAVNAAYMLASTTAPDGYTQKQMEEGELIPKAFIATRRKLLAQNKATEQNGMLVVVK